MRRRTRWGWLGRRQGRVPRDGEWRGGGVVSVVVFSRVALAFAGFRRSNLMVSRSSL